MRFRDEDIQKLLDSLNIVDVVGEVVDLKQSGSSYKGLCPFHDDKSPSFMVSPSKNICKCFVCGAGGNPLTFYKEYHKLDFSSAVVELSQKFNINIKAVKGYDKVQEKNNKLYEIMNEALNYYTNNIFTNEGREALEYLIKRDFNPEFIKRQKLGFAKNSWSALYEFLLNKGYSTEDILKVGLIKEGEKGYYDTFRDRVMFPIFLSGTTKVIAFGGRILEDRKGIAKYLNSPETEIFDKGSNLYGIDERGSLIRKKSYAILMEGYMDVLAAKSYGFDVALASLGTAFTANQAKLLKRYTSNVIISYDMDKAGQDASERTSLILKEYGFNIRVLQFKDAKDPDEFLKKFGREKFLEAVKNSKEIFDFLFEKYSKMYDLSNHVAKQNFITHFKDFFRVVETELEKMLYLEKLSGQIGIDKDILYQILVKDNIKVERKPVLKEIKKSHKIYKVKKRDSLEEDTLRLMFLDKKYYELLKNKEIKDEFLKKIVNSIEKNFKEENYLKMLINSEEFDENEKEAIFELAGNNFKYSNDREKKNVFEQTFIAWFRRELKEKMQEYKEHGKRMLHFRLKLIIEELKSLEEKNQDIKELYKKFLDTIID